MENFLKLKCSKCGDILTNGELRSNYNKPRIIEKDFTCYQCSMKTIEGIRNKRKILEVGENHNCNLSPDDSCSHSNHIQL